MKIIRKVNGRTMHFELSDDELCSAYWEQQERFDVQSVINYIESNYEDDEGERESVNDHELIEVRECIDIRGSSLESALEFIVPSKVEDYLMEKEDDSESERLDLIP